MLIDNTFALYFIGNLVLLIWVYELNNNIVLKMTIFSCHVVLYFKRVNIRLSGCSRQLSYFSHYKNISTRQLLESSFSLRCHFSDQTAGFSENKKITSRQ